MGRLRLLAATVLFTVGLSVLSATPASAQSPAPAASAQAAPAHPKAVSYYVSLGDSLAQGVQANPQDGSSVLTPFGYPDQLYAQLKKSHPSLQLIKLGCPGETTTTMITGGICRYPSATSQVAQAVAFLRASRGHVAYLTINIGSNDVLQCTNFPTTIDAPCLAKAFATVGANLTTILGVLRSTVGWRTATAGMTYYDPLLAAWTINRPLATQSVAATDQLNAVESAAYRRAGFRVAQVAAAFQTDNFQVPKNSSLPVNVVRVCALTWMCGAKPNVHPNTAGYSVIARSFAEALGCWRRW